MSNDIIVLGLLIHSILLACSTINLAVRIIRSTNDPDWQTGYAYSLILSKQFKRRNNAFVDSQSETIILLCYGVSVTNRLGAIKLELDRTDLTVKRRRPNSILELAVERVTSQKAKHQPAERDRFPAAATHIPYFPALSRRYR